MTDFAAEMLQVTYFVIRCEAMFSKCDLRFSSTFESNLASCVNPSSAKRGEMPKNISLLENPTQI